MVTSIAEIINHSGINAVITAVNARWQHKLDLLGDDIRKMYPVADDEAVLDIIEALEKQADCQKCLAEGRQTCLHYDQKAWDIAPDGTVTKHLCQKRQSEMHEDKCQTANIPRLYRHLTLEDYAIDNQNKAAVRTAVKAMQQGRGLFIHGTFGTGKTMLASILAQELIRKSIPVYFASTAELVYQLETLSREENAAIFDRMQRCHLLVIDDLGAEGLTARIEALLYNIINTKYNNNNRVIVTTNLSADTVPNTDAMKRIFSRLKGTCAEVTLEGADRRRTRITS